MYCKECEQYFDTPYRALEMHPEVGEFGVTPYEEFDVCPYCGSTDIEETHTCELCGEDKALELEDYCEDCKADGLGEIMSLVDKYNSDFIEFIAGEYFKW